MTLCRSATCEKQRRPSEIDNYRALLAILSISLAICLGPVACAGEQLDVLWAKRAGGSLLDEGRATAVDASGNIYITGRFEGTAKFGGTTLTSAGQTDVFVAKYDSFGNVLWTGSAGGLGWDTGLGVAVDGAGNVYVTGDYSGAASFGDIMLTSAGLTDVFVAKYDSFGSILWVASAGGKEWDKGLCVAVDSTGSVCVAGRFEVTASFGGITLTGDFAGDAFVAKYDGSGNILWAERPVAGVVRVMKEALALRGGETGVFTSPGHFRERSPSVVLLSLARG